MAAPIPVSIHWQLSSYSGWGTVGINLFLEWANDDELVPLTSVPHHNMIVVDGLRRQRLEPHLVQSEHLQSSIPRGGDGLVDINIPVLEATGNSWHCEPHPGRLRGRPSISLLVFENTRFSPSAIESARPYPLIVTASRWNEELLRAAGVEHVRTVWQGVDRTLFHPAPRSGWYRDRFVIFSGGKVELRKGQDLVLRTFRVFAKRHPESLLVTAWQSPWPQFARDFGARHSVEPAPFTSSGQVDVKGWAVANGIREDQVIDIGHVANPLMPAVLREMDVALFPNRAEGGTNLVAMEAMACGIPCVLSRNTGHRDIMTSPDAAEPNCYPLEHQRSVDDESRGTDGWGESDVDEAVEMLEAVWRDRETAAARGARGAESMTALSWRSQASALKQAIMPVLRAGTI